MVTMMDIARISGYSRSTVSAVFRGKTTVSQRARDKIMSVVKEHHYEPNMIARALVSKESRLIGVVVRDLTNPYYLQFLTGVQEVVSEAHYDLLYFDTQESHDKEIKILQRLSAYQVAGLLLSPVLRGVELEHIWAFSRNRRPLITLERVQGFEIDHVAFQDERGGFLAGRHLAENGHRRIAYLAGPSTSMSSEEREAGLRRALTGIAKPQIVPCGATSEAGYDTAMQLLSDPAKRPTALFCFNDLMAIGVYRAANKLGLRIPDDLSVVGFDDIDIAPVMGPPLSSVSYSMRDVGRRVARALLEQIAEGETRKHYRETIKPRLSQRDSVAPPV